MPTSGRNGVRRAFDAVGVGYTALDYLGVVPHFPEENRKLELRSLTIQGGGPAATAIVTVRRLGLSASLIAKVGDDSFGTRMLDELAAEGVDLSSVIGAPGARSQFAFIMVDERTAARTILWTRGTVPRIDPSEVDLDLVRSARALLVDSMEPAGALAAVRAARAARVPVVLDAGTMREGVEELLPLCDYIVASEVFARQVGGEGGVREALRVMFSYAPEAAVVTLGERGCVGLSGDGYVEVPAFPVKAVDTTGAGDVFHGAFLVAVLQGWDLNRICLFANGVSAMKCTKLGGRAGIPGRGEAVSFLGRRCPGVSFRFADPPSR